MSNFDTNIVHATPVYEPDAKANYISPSAPAFSQIYPQDIQINYPGIPIDSMDRFRNLVEKYSISMEFAMRLRELDGYEIVVILDDSGSMSSPVSKPNDPFVKTETRWQEAQRSAKIIVDIASVFDPDGVDIYYLNRSPILNVHDATELDSHPIFSRYPDGSTPLGETIGRVLSAKSKCERKLLLVVFTDGQPDNMKLFKSILANRKPIDKIFVSLVACTDDSNAVGYLNEIDKTIKNVDTNDDYFSELHEIKQVQGPGFPFTFGDYICKILLGPVCPHFDKLDEHKLTLRDLGAIKQKPKPTINNKDSCIVS